MNTQQVISTINETLHYSTTLLSTWLQRHLPRVTRDWWNECVISKLSYNQRTIAQEKAITKLIEFDLAALLTIADRNWYAMREFLFLPSSERECIRKMMKVRNNWAHCSGELPPAISIESDLSVLVSFLEQMHADNSKINTLKNYKNNISNLPIINDEQDNNEPDDSDIKEKSIVRLVGQPDIKGFVVSVETINGEKKYQVFVGAEIKTFYANQIQPDSDNANYKWISLSSLQSYLSAFEINNPSTGNLYSLNSARIDFVPYQFRPALKMIKADEPRILIADSVGVGKTIEAGLIIKELEARSDLENVMIICPKPLISERKWELEMKRFDEEFIPLDGNALRQIIQDTDRDGEWPVRYSKTIVPYSILDSRTYLGTEKGRISQIGLEGLDPAPHFDLVIIDEAHHIRNGSMEKEKAFAYKCVKYFCDNADAVIMLTATPLQTGDDDLYTLLNVLRPDVIMDKASFALMAQPNEYISRAVSILRRAQDKNWRLQALEELNGVVGTQWGESVISENPLYHSVVERLEKPVLSREERVKLITDVESLHSFHNMLNRTRRRDIQDFCIRRTNTLEVSFTVRQEELHNELLNFERTALARMHNIRSVPFMMSTIKRQAASCIFGLAPHIRDIINRRFSQLADDPDFDFDNFDYDNNTKASLESLAAKVLSLADNLPKDDPKFKSLLQVLTSKQSSENNKVIIFSTFRYTLRYIKHKLLQLGYRVEHIDGGVKDEDRFILRNRFALPREDENAIDILLFTEVGSEGLDYQFCHTMINYDLPWNPMRIEQRIGRIDRRGQQSEYVDIYNLITSGTVDADIYNRCLLRIGVFEKSIGECEEILGEIATQIEKISSNAKLTDDEKRIKLEQMADNEVRKIQEMTRLEDEERELFGFDLSQETMSNEVQSAESPWLSADSLLNLVKLYLCERIGEGNYILGEGDLKTLRLSYKARQLMKEDSRKLPGSINALRRRWEKYLKGTVPNQAITFDSDCASKNRNAFFITNTHPLVKQAAAYFAVKSPTFISVIYDCETIASGEYAFSIYAWNYVGHKPHFRLLTVCENENVPQEFLNILHSGSQGKPTNNDIYAARWNALEEKQYQLWKTEKAKNADDAKQSANYKIQSLKNNFEAKKRIIFQQLASTDDINITRMRNQQLENEKEKLAAKIEMLEKQSAQADIHTTLIANGIIKVI